MRSENTENSVSQKAEYHSSFVKNSLPMEQITTISNITTREKQILRLVAREYSTIESSTILRISVRTVETHRKNILRKINSRSLAGLTKHAIKLGLLEDYVYRPVIDTNALRKPKKPNPE